MATTAVPRTTATPLLTRNKVGLVILGLLGLVDLSGPFVPLDPDEVGPPVGIIVLDTLLGLLTVILVVVAFRTGARRAIRVLVGIRLLSAATAIPAFFAGVSTALLVSVCATMLLTFAGVVLTLMPARRDARVLD